MRCPYCGERNPNNTKRCLNCGRKLTHSKQVKKERNIVLTGVFLVLVIVAAGIGAMYAVSEFLDGTTTTGLTESKVTINSTPTPTPTTTAEDSTSGETDSAVASSSSETEDTEDEEPVTATLLATMPQIDLLGYSELEVSSVEATSELQQVGLDNSPEVLFDDDDTTSWQEGVSGDGIGEYVTITLNGEHTVRYLAFKLGNWRSTNSYGNNGRPQTLTITVGEESFTVEFPDEREEYCVELSRDVEASGITVTIDAVYTGALYADTCITEMDIYGY